MSKPEWILNRKNGTIGIDDKEVYKTDITDYPKNINSYYKEELEFSSYNEQAFFFYKKDKASQIFRLIYEIFNILDSNSIGVSRDNSIKHIQKFIYKKDITSTKSPIALNIFIDIEQNRGLLTVEKIVSMLMYTYGLDKYVET